MDVDAPNATAEGCKALIRQPYAVIHCTLWDPVNNRDDTAMPGTTDKRQQRRLNDVEGCFSYFPDLSVRTPNTYSLIFKLVTLNPLIIGPGYAAPVRSTAMSSAFNVYNAKNFGSMSASTELTKRLKHQGCLVSVKKGNAKKNEREEDEEEDDDDDDEDDEDDDDVEDGGKGKKPAKRRWIG